MAETPADSKKDLAQIVTGSSEITEQVQPRTRRKSKYDGPNEEFLQMLINLGMSRNAAEKVSCVPTCQACLTQSIWEMVNYTYRLFVRW